MKGERESAACQLSNPEQNWTKIKPPFVEQDQHHFEEIDLFLCSDFWWVWLAPIGFSQWLIYLSYESKNIAEGEQEYK